MLQNSFPGIRSSLVYNLIENYVSGGGNGEGAMSNAMMREALDELEKPSSQSYGSVLGDLLTISFARHRRFYLYPPLGPSSVACFFSSGLEKRALQNIKKRVRCYGTKYFRPADGLPFRMDVERIEPIVLPKRFSALPKKRPYKGEPADVLIARDRDEEWD